LLTRNIKLDPLDLTIEEKFFRGAKRICTIGAVAALTLCALDLAGIRTVENAAALINDNQTRLADLPERIRSAIDSISITPLSPSVTVAIPRGDIIAGSRLSLAVARSDASPVAQLASLRQSDAIEFAMESPLASAKSPQHFAAEPAPLVAPEPAPLKLASIDVAGASTASIPSLQESLSQPISTSIIPLGMVPMPRAAPGVPPPSPAERLHLEGKDRAKAERCLANAIYFEARSEPVRGQMAVAQVVINRAFSGFYPNDICGVIYQNASRHLACQFTFACDGKSKAILERGEWARANRIAKQTLDGQIYVPEVAKSTHYHAIYVHPNWVGEMKKMVRFGIHNFYRPYAWGNGAEEPVWGSGVVASAKKNN
jgi:cell wall hydrolase